MNEVSEYFRRNVVVDKAREFARDMVFICESEGDAEWTTFKESLQHEDKIAAILAYRAEMSYWKH